MSINRTIEAKRKALTQLSEWFLLVMPGNALQIVDHHSKKQLVKFEKNALHNIKHDT